MIGGGGIFRRVVGDQLDTSEKRFGVVDHTPGQALLPLLQAAAQERNEKEVFDADGRKVKPEFTIVAVQATSDTPEAVSQQRFELSNQVRQKEIFGFLEIGPDVAVHRKNPAEAKHGDDRSRIRSRGLLSCHRAGRAAGRDLKGDGHRTLQESPHGG